LRPSIEEVGKVFRIIVRNWYLGQCQGVPNRIGWYWWWQPNCYIFN